MTTTKRRMNESSVQARQGETQSESWALQEWKKAMILIEIFHRTKLNWGLRASFNAPIIRRRLLRTYNGRHLMLLLALGVDTYFFGRGIDIDLQVESTSALRSLLTICECFIVFMFSQEQTNLRQWYYFIGVWIYALWRAGLRPGKPKILKK